MKKIFLLILYMLALAVYAQNPYERITLSDGSILEGYIEKQILGENMTFNASNAEIIVDSKYISVHSETPVNIDDLPEQWKDYLKGQKSDMATCREVRLNLANISALKDSIDKMGLLAQVNNTNNVKLLEKGSICKIQVVSPQSYQIKPNDITLIERDTCTSTMLSKTVDVIETYDGRVLRGRIVCYIPNKLLKIQDENGDIFNISFTELLSESKVGYNQELTLIEQCRYIDIVKTNTKTYEGIITKKFYGTKDEKSYILIETKDNGEKRVPINDVTEIIRQENAAYREVIRSNIKLDDVFANDSLLEFTAVGMEKNPDRFVLSKDSVQICKITTAGSLIEVKIKLHKDSDENDFFMMKAEENKKKGIWSFDYSSLFNCIRPMSCRKELNGEKTLIYNLHTGSSYLFYRKKDSKCAVITLK